MPNVQTVSNQLVPSDVPKCIVQVIDFSVGSSFELDLLTDQQLTKIGMVQTLYLDLKDTALGMDVEMSGTGQVIRAKARTQGYYNVLQPNPAKLRFTSADASLIVRVFIIGVPIPGAVWSTI
jgi:hypothetical protein